MALCTFSSKLAMDGFTVVDNVFLNEFLPGATGDDVKVYMYGLALCSNPNLEDNSIDTICKVLALTEDQVLKSFSYWQDMGLVQLASTKPLEIKFLPIRAHSGSAKIRNKDKYAGFNQEIQKVITGRMLTPNEFNEYYSLIETYHFEPEALVLIARYCVSIKNNSIGYPYILAVARDFAKDGLKTQEAIDQKLLEQEQSSKEIKQILSALGLKREADPEERNLYIKWTSHFGFTHGVVLEIAKSLKKKGGFAKLDGLMCKYYEQKLFTMEEITHYSDQREALFETAKNISRTLGLYYQNLENVVDTYIADWFNKGFETDTLNFISNYCFKQSIRTLDGMNTIIQKFYKLGLISTPSIEQYIGSILKADESIKQVLDKTGLVRSVSSYDRDFYKTWTENWGFSHEQIMLVADACVGKSSPMSYLNKLLADLHEQGVSVTKDIANALKTKPTSTKQTPEKEQYATHNYSKEQLSAVFDSLDDVEI